MKFATRNTALIVVLAALLLLQPAVLAASTTTKLKNNLQITGNLQVDGTSTLTGATTQTGNLTLSGNLAVTGTTALTGVATLTAAPVLSTATLTANGDTITIEDLGDANIIQSVGTQTIGGVKTFTSIPVFPATGITFDQTTGNITFVPADPAANRQINIPDAGATSSLVLTESAQTINGVKTFGSAPLVPDGSFTRSDLVQEDLAKYAINFGLLRTNAGVVLAGSETAGTFHLVDGGIGTGSLTVNGEESLSETETSTMAFSFQLPPEYVDGETVTLHLRADVTGGGTLGTTKTIDAEVYELTNNGAVGADICATGAGTLVAATPTDFDFTITPTGLVAGDRLQVYIQTAVEETAATAIRAVISEIELQCDIKG